MCCCHAVVKQLCLFHCSAMPVPCNPRRCMTSSSRFLTVPAVSCPPPPSPPETDPLHWSEPTLQSPPPSSLLSSHYHPCPFPKPCRPTSEFHPDITAAWNDYLMQGGGAAAGKRSNARPGLPEDLRFIVRVGRYMLWNKDLVGWRG